jgi:hypothetical protein
MQSGLRCRNATARRTVALVALAIVFAGGSAVGRVRVFVNNARLPDGGHGTSVLWQSAAAQRECLDAIVGRFQSSLQALLVGQRPAFPPGAGWSEPVCTNALLGDLTQGTEVELLDGGPECGSLARVRVVTGRVAEQVGCVAADRLSSEPAR